MEDRLVPVSGNLYTVTALTDTGTGSGLSGDLRYCINASNADNNLDTITFASSLFQNGPATISLSNTLYLTNTNGITIAGPGANLLSISGGNQRFTDFSTATTTNVNATLENLSITDGGLLGNYIEGGGIDNSSGNTLTINNCNISGNATEYYGGGIYNDGTLNINDSTISGNSGADGGGIFCDDQAMLNINASTIYNNSSLYDGGGIYSYNSQFLVSNTTFSNNSASDGGAFFVYNYVNLEDTISDSTFMRNRASGDGGAIYCTDGSMSISNSTFSGNDSGIEGGAVYNYETNLFVNSSTFSGNVSSDEPGGAIFNDGELSLSNSILANSLSSVSGGTNIQDLYTAYPINLYENNLVMSSNYANNGTNIYGENPDLTPLGNYGGPTETFALLPGSPALGTGSTSADASLNTDQRGLSRVVNGKTDIGAFETQPLVVNTTADATVSPSGILALREAVLLADAVGGNNYITFNSNVFSRPQTIELTAGPLTITTGSLYIGGPSVPSALTITTQLGRAFSVNASAELEVAFLTISGCEAVGKGAVPLLRLLSGHLHRNFFFAVGSWR
jgi:predicted outer membrane repeat protein